MITNDFFLAKDNYRIGAQILRENKILRDHAAERAMVATPGKTRLGSGHINREARRRPWLVQSHFGARRGRRARRAQQRP
jgi:hypothetical protein